MSVETCPSKSVMLLRTNILISWFRSAKIKFPQNKGIQIPRTSKSILDYLRKYNLQIGLKLGDVYLRTGSGQQMKSGFSRQQILICKNADFSRQQIRHVATE